ncbi:hypothetical protein ACS5PN_26520 [Roseateles sp. NT4]|uniref:hypothetical protein n=1 Tax=Roseateles sp. NT4 TaxID=3453715 RepID=UPI003EEEBBA3
MDAFWNDGETDAIKGLDALGVRNFDQRVERAWMGSITTISPRAIYFCLLPWLVTEHYLRHLRQVPGGAALVEAAPEDLSAAMHRLEFVVVAASIGRPGLPPSPVAPLGSGLIGPDVFRTDLDALETQGRVALPTESKGTMLGVYFQPCRGFGLLDHTQDAQRVIVPARGREIHLAQQALVEGSELERLIFDGGELTREALLAHGVHFSAHALANPGRRRELLTQALLSSATATDGALGGEGIYRNFLATTRWAFSCLDGSAATATALIQRAYVSAQTHASLSNPAASPALAALSIGRYEFLRRTHHALELLFCALNETLHKAATAEQAVAVWDAEEGQLLCRLPWPERPLRCTMTELTQQLPGDFLTQRLTVRGAAGLDAREKALYALAMLLSDSLHSESLRADGAWNDISREARRAMQILAAARGSAAADVMVQLLDEIVVESHIHTTLRKMMSPQGRYSLRFMRDGSTLIPTGAAASPGFSGDRLRNLLSVWADLGALQVAGGAGMQLSEEGRAIALRIDEYFAS